MLYMLSNDRKLSVADHTAVLVDKPCDSAPRAGEAWLLCEMVQLTLHEESDTTWLVVSLSTQQIITITEQGEREALRSAYRELTRWMEMSRMAVITVGR